jgi:glycosyltransferase involved in cell wall biosynthesis
LESTNSHQQSASALLFNQYKACILLPTYNNHQTILEVIRKSLLQTNHVIVINDGSTDNTLAIIKDEPVQIVSYDKNKGKGYAIRQGFKYAIAEGYDYAITIDTDGQHYPEDCIHFLNELEKNEAAVMIGSRDLSHENVPGKSTFGRKFSNFWFKIETGKDMPDTQSGFRLYPIYKYKNSLFFTRKYEFEIEIIVRSAWQGLPIIAVPINVFYPTREERITHFRPFKDFFRISLLNTVLVLIAFLYIKPRDLILRPIREKGIKNGLKELLFNPHETKFIRASSVGFGVFMGIIPIWGFQLLVGIPLAILMKMNKTLFIVAANISIFPPIIWAASLATGKLIYRNPNWKINFKNLTMDQVLNTGKEFFVGGTVLAIIAGLVFFSITYLLLNFKRKKINPIP